MKRNRISGSLIVLSAVFSLSGLLFRCEESKVQISEWVVTAANDFGRRPLWSPDGDRLLFGDDRPGESGLWRWDLSNPPERLTAQHFPHNWDFEWSPNGSQVAFSAPGTGSDSTAGIWVIEIADGTTRRLTDQGFQVSWWDDSTLVARIEDPPDGNAGLFTINAASGRIMRLIDGGWNPQGSGGGAVAFATGEVRGTLQVLTRDGSSIPVTNPSVQWRWSGDGAALMAIFNDWTSGDLTGTLVKLTFQGESVFADTIARWCGWPAPNRDGSKAAFVRISNHRFTGLGVWSAGSGETWIAGFGRNPSHHPWEDKVAVDTGGSGVRVLALVTHGV